eukprot:3039159-Rhodomonas_salina.2
MAPRCQSRSSRRHETSPNSSYTCCSASSSADAAAGAAAADAVVESASRLGRMKRLSVSYGTPSKPLGSALRSAALMREETRMLASRHVMGKSTSVSAAS